MVATAPSTRNPFPAEAVVSYGAGALTSAPLSYMTTAQEALNAYLATYPQAQFRQGGTMGLRGSHGSGKTHLLAWLADAARGVKNIRSTVLYGKADTSRISDLYRQFIDGLKRDHINQLIQLALLNLARDKVRAAEVTEALADRLENADALQTLQAEENLDLEQLRQQLLQQLEEQSPASEEMVRILLDVPNPRVGDSAYAWLLGRPIDDAATLGTVKVLLPSESADGGADLAAISALGMIAALHSAAGVPLLVLFDQLEVYLRVADDDQFNQVGSHIKKFVEQLTHQNALTFIAGTAEAWAKLPPDVSDRLRIREPITVGGLALDEAKLLIDAYLKERPDIEPLAPAAIETIHELTGGTPREILRICFEAFEQTNGQLSEIDDRILFQSARNSGSIQSRAKRALAIADVALQRLGTVVHNFAVAGEQLDRAVFDPSGRPVAALIIIKATDALDEVDSARRVHSLRSQLMQSWPQCTLIVVAVGYSSAEVRETLGDVEPIVFDERTLEGELSASFAAAKERRQQSTPALASSQETLKLSLDIDHLLKRLNQLEEERASERERVRERFAASAGELAASASAERELKTRSELLDALEFLRDALEAGEPDAEKTILRSILIGNESHLQSADLDELASSYRELLAIQRLQNADPQPLTMERLDLIAAMRRELQSSAFGRLLRPRQMMLGIAICAALFVLTGLISSIVYQEYPYPTIFFLPAAGTFTSALPFLFLGLTSLLVYVAAFNWLRRVLRRSRNRNRLIELRGRVEGRRAEGSIRELFPQA